MKSTRARARRNPTSPTCCYANKLVETETVEARQQAGKKDSMVFTIAGASSPAKTPMAEPIFLIDADKLNVNAFELYKLDVKGGNREITTATGRRGKGGARPLKLTIQRVAEHLYSASKPVKVWRTVSIRCRRATQTRRSASRSTKTSSTDEKLHPRLACYNPSIYVPRA